MYLKLKMPGPNGVIMVSGDFQHTHKCGVGNVALAKAELAVAEFAKIHKMVDL